MVKLFLILSMFCLTVHVNAEVYLIIYATHNGNTGHCGIAVDNYKIVIKEYSHEGHIKFRNDTIPTGTLTYYDLWPMQDNYKEKYDGEVEPHYYKLPSSSWKQFISTKTLADEGVPHKFDYPCDGIVSIPSTKNKDIRMISYLNALVNENRNFSAMKFNCCDFIVQALTQHVGHEIYAKEFIVKGEVTTPNELFKVVANWPGSIILKDPGTRIEGSFFEERIVARILPFLNIF